MTPEEREDVKKLELALKRLAHFEGRRSDVVEAAKRWRLGTRSLYDVLALQEAVDALLELEGKHPPPAVAAAKRRR